MTPGFFTDTIGFLCLIPITRQLMVNQIIKRSLFKAQSGVPGSNRSGVDGDIIEGEYSHKPTKTIDRD